MRLGLREANQAFSKAIRTVRAGKDVVLTDRGRPIARITPFKEKDASAAALRAMADEGVITLAPRKGSMPQPRWRPARVTGQPLSRTVIDERDDRA